VYRTRVAWSDTDASGRIHFTAPFRWAENAENDLRRALSLPLDLGTLPRRHVEAGYLERLDADEEVELRLQVAAVGRTSITYVWNVYARGVRCVEGRHVVVHVDGNGTPQALPDDVRRLLG
jgi:acyl-CoA thioesterase FadM